METSIDTILERGGNQLLLGKNQIDKRSKTTLVFYIQRRALGEKS